jgi:hypothetical protein
VKKIAASSPVDIARAVAGAIGYERLTETFREEISELQILLKKPRVIRLILRSNEVVYIPQILFHL